VLAVLAYLRAAAQAPADDARSAEPRCERLLDLRAPAGPLDALDLLRTHSQRSGRRLLDLAEAVADSHQLLISRDSGDSERRNLTA
jgi:hypothetical protein